MKKKYKDVYYDVPDVKTIKELVIHGVGEGKDQPLFMYDNVNGTKDNPFITKTFNDVWHDQLPGHIYVCPRRQGLQCRHYRRELL